MIIPGLQHVLNEASLLDYVKSTSKKYLDSGRAGGILLIIASIAALIIANSALAEAYHHVLEYDVILAVAHVFKFSLSLEKFINDGLMAIFFLVAGLELKREILVGELSTKRSAVLPVVAAIGGVVVPAIIFFLLNNGQPTLTGWGIPVATDIAYSLGILGLLGSRVPGELKALLVGIAIADDLIAVLIIAFFYTDQLQWGYLAATAIAYGALWGFNLLNIKPVRWYMIGGVVLWFFMLKSGIHPTLAGVLLAFTIPVRPEIGSLEMKRRSEQYAAMLAETNIETSGPMRDKKQRAILKDIDRDTRRSRPPLLRLENGLSGFNAFFIIPLFALANAGVALDVEFSALLQSDLALGIFLGLVVGKVAGISLFSLLGKTLGFLDFADTLSNLHIIGLGLLAGIGFTMSLFITGLAFADAAYVQLAKISILAASVVAALGGVAVLLIAGNGTEQ